MFRFKREFIAVVSCFLLGIIITFAVYVVPFFFPFRGERILDKWETGSETVRIRVTSFAEENSFVPGSYYVLESAGSSGEYRKIMTFRHDDRIPIDKRSIVVLSNKVIYVFTGWKFAVTTDNGKTWSIWDGSKELAQWKCCNYGLIEAVEIDQNGTGKMSLGRTNTGDSNTRSDNQNILLTTDFGKTWNGSLNH